MTDILKRIENTNTYTRNGKPMTNDEILLFLIENVDHTDADACAELNARFWCFLRHQDYKDHRYQSLFETLYVSYADGYAEDKCPLYTTSVDACLAVLPDGWYPSLEVASVDLTPKYSWTLYLAKQRDVIRCSYYLPTIQLALMHAIAQAVIFERENE